MHRKIFALLAAGLASLAISQRSMAQPPLPGGAQLVYVRVIAPAGTQVSFYRGTPVANRFAAPVTVGMRPGYIHRIQLSDIPGHPGLTLYPTFEVRGTLYLPEKLRASSFPAAVTFSPTEIERIVRGVLLTKVVYLEDPEKAVPASATVDQPIEIDVRPGDDPLEVARHYGRPMIVVRVGTRVVEPEEMVRQTGPGLIMLPGEPMLPRPLIPPYMAFNCWPLYDPIAGPAMPHEECMKDGGDVGLPAGFDKDGNLRGVDPSDSVAEYKDLVGRKHLAISNRVCVCVPRFVVMRADTPLAGYETLTGPEMNHTVLNQLSLGVKAPSLEEDLAIGPRALRLRERPSVALTAQLPLKIVVLQILQARDVISGPRMDIFAIGPRERTLEQHTLLLKQVEIAYQFSVHEGVRVEKGIEGPAVVGQIEETQVKTLLQEARDFVACCEDKIEVPDKPLLLCKWAEQREVHQGDIVTFHLKYTNVGGKPITDVAVSDSLTGRLEYVPGSARSDRDAVFTMQQNEAGSLVLRWEITGTLQPGKSGVVTFQAKIR